MKKIIPYYALFLTVSCQFFDKNKLPNETQLLNQRLKEINWHAVDELPSVFGCDSVLDKSQKKICFFDHLTQTMNQSINKDSLALLYPKKTFILVMVSVFPNEELQFQSMLKNATNADQVAIDNFLNEKLAGFATIKPALKRGIPVKSEFLIRLELKK